MDSPALLTKVDPFDRNHPDPSLPLQNAWVTEYGKI